MTVMLHRPPMPPLGPDLARRWGAISTTVTADLFEGRTLADPAIRPLRRMGAGPRLVGRAVTVRVNPPDFGAVLHAIDHAGRGDVLVIATGGHTGVAVVGDILGGAARRKGVAGIVCDGAVRDIAVLADWSDFPVFARASTARGPSSKLHGTVNATVSFGGVAVEPGALVIGDDDGLVILPPGEAEALIPAAEARVAAEAVWVKRIDAGESLREVFGVPDPTVEER